MKTAKLALAVVFVLQAGGARAEETLREIHWDGAAPPESTLVSTDRGWSAARVVWNGEGPKVFRLGRIERPGIAADRYALSGEIRYEDVHAGSYLEMWNHLPGGEAFFSRTLALTGPMGQLSGSSDWRRFTLPAFLNDHPARPVALELNLVLTGPGVVEIGPLTLSQPAPGETPAGTARWGWSVLASGLVTAIGAGVMFLLGIPLLVLLLLARARQLVTAGAWVLVATGLVIAIIGFVSVLVGQPLRVFLSPIVLGPALCVLGIGLLVAAPSRYRDLELRRMQAIDAS